MALFYSFYSLFICFIFQQNQKNNEQLSNVADANKEKEGKIQQFEEQIKALSLKIEELNTLNKQQRVYRFYFYKRTGFYKKPCYFMFFPPRPNFVNSLIRN